MLISEQTDFAPLFTGNVNLINTTLQQYGKGVDLSGFLNISGITDSTIRRYLMHSTWMKIRKTNLYDPTQNFLAGLRYLGLVSTSTTSDYKVGFEIYERQKRYITGATITNTGVNNAVKIVLPATYSLANGIVADLNQILEIDQTRFQVRVVGIDNGTGNNLKNMGVTDANAAMTPGGAGGTSSANVLICVPLTTQAAPAVTTNGKLFFVGNSRAERSCSDNALLQIYPNIYESGFTISDATINFSGTAGATARNWKCGIMNGRGGKLDLMVSDLDFQLEEETQNRLVSAILFGQKETATSVLSTSRHTRQSNGIMTAIAVNGGTIIQTTPGSITFANTINPIIDFCIARGIKSGKLFVGSGLYADLQTSTALIPSTWLTNMRVMPFSSTSDGINFNFTSNMIDWRGVKIELIPFNMFTDSNQWGIGYNNTGMFIPNKMTTVKNMATGQMIDVPPVQVLFKKDYAGRIRDEQYEMVDGGAGVPQIGTCDFAEKRRLPEFTVVSPLASECILLQPTTIS